MLKSQEITSVLFTYQIFRNLLKKYNPFQICSFGSVNGATLSSVTEFSPVPAFDVGEQELLTLRLSIAIQPNSAICEKHVARILTMICIKRNAVIPFKNTRKQ